MALLFCRKLMKNTEDGNDLYQDSVLVAHRSFKDLRQEDSFRPWLYRIIINTFKSTIRRPWWKKRETLDIESINSRAHNPDGQYDARRQIALALTALSARDQALVTLFEIDGWTIRELAELRNTSESSIKVKLHRIRAKMRVALVKPKRMERKRRAMVANLKQSGTNQERSHKCIATD